MQGKTVLITGATSGIGYATARALIGLGADLYFVARDAARAETVKNEIGAKGYFIAELSSQRSLRDAAMQIRNQLPAIDVLINNAGAVYTSFTLTEDGIEKTIAVNHFAYYLLTMMLLENIKKSAYARIICVSSDSHYHGKLDVESFTKNKGYFVNKAYAQSKLANVLFTRELAGRLSGTHVTVNCLHPGLVQTNIGHKGTAWYARMAWGLMTGLFGVPLDEGARTTVYLASSPDVKDMRGLYFDNCKPKEPSALARDSALQQMLWETTERLCPLG
ncbi:MAG: SDR family oxidoreductase [Chitinophagales bacterium]|nr:SDR family oxidoreductase [Chitinophagales bacterium]MDW8420065.1 SDR family oxidoreductase [Chitinophagales bacterium]